MRRKIVYIVQRQLFHAVTVEKLVESKSKLGRQCFTSVDACYWYWCWSQYSARIPAISPPALIGKLLTNASASNHYSQRPFQSASFTSKEVYRLTGMGLGSENIKEPESHTGMSMSRQPYFQPPCRIFRVNQPIFAFTIACPSIPTISSRSPREGGRKGRECRAYLTAEAPLPFN